MTSFTNKNILNLLRNLPRLSISNLRNNDGAVKKNKRGRGQHGGDKHGAGNKGSKARQNFMRPGYETGNTPFYMKFPREQYYKDHHIKRQYPPLSLYTLQKMIDLNRLDITKPIDLAALCNTGLFNINPEDKHFGVNLIDEGADIFKAKINIEVQWTNEPTIAAIEKNGGVITTSFFDINSLFILINPKKFFQRGEAIPRRMIPPEDSILYYSSAANRGYLADPEKISWERFVLAQKYGYKLAKIEDDPDYEMLVTRKDQRQIFYGLEPGWVVNLKDKVILKPVDSQLKEFYRS